MADDNAKELLRVSDAMFTNKLHLDSLNQTLSDEFFPERATFTRTRNDGDEYAERLYTSLPAQNRRDLAYAMGTLTRPDNQQWFDVKARDEARNTDRAKAWFARARDRMRTLLYSRESNFQIEAGASDDDVIAFGNAVLRHTEAADRSGILVYACEHLRDCAWAENRFRVVNRLDRKFKLQLRNWDAAFPDHALPERYKSTLKNNPFHEVELRHIVLPADQYDPYGKQSKKKRAGWQKRFASIYVDPAGSETLREGGYFEFPYTVRRWRLQPNSPYGYSPASMLGLIEARLLQGQERVIMDAGERVVDPPSVAVRDAVLGRINNYAGATTWIDGEYDERTGEAVRFVDQRANIPIGLEMKKDTRQVLAAAQFINKLTLPSDKDMTAFEVDERISEYIRSIAPVAKPFQMHNAQMLDFSFAFNLRVGNLGSIAAIPEELRGADIDYEFDGPIQIAYKRQKLQKVKQTAQGAAELMQIKPETADNFDFDKMARDGASYVNGEPDWLIPEEIVQQGRAQKAQQMAQQQALQSVAAGAQAAGAAADAVPKIAAANKALPQVMQQDGQQGADQEGFGPPQRSAAA